LAKLLAEQGVAGTGLRRSGWDSYHLTTRPRVLSTEQAQRLRLAHGGRVSLSAWAAALLSHIITGIPEPYRTAGIDVLLERGLITATAHGYRPSDELIFSLRLDCWQY
jgi:hypothetical protein